MTNEGVSYAHLVGMSVHRGPEGTQLTMTGDLAEVSFPIRPASKKTAIRFAVGEPGLRATVWRLWANAGADDVYLASRQTADEMKISLHQSGDWRMQIVQPDRPKTIHFGSRAEDAGRVLLRWRRPEPDSVGWAHALTIALPEDQLNLIPADSVRWDDIRWLPAPTLGQQVEFDVHIVRPNGGIRGLQQILADGVRVSVMDALRLASGAVVVVTALTGPARPDELAWVASMEAGSSLCDRLL